MLFKLLKFSYIFIRTNILRGIYLILPDKIIKNFQQKKITYSILGLSIVTNRGERFKENDFKNLISEIKKINISQKKNKVALDIGGNFGIYSCALKLSDYDKIYVFEPNKQIFNYMIDNFQKNNLENIFSFPFGIYDKSETLELSSPVYANKQIIKKSDRFRSGALTLKGSGNDSIESEFKRYSDIEVFKTLDACDLIKIDAEGSEIIILKELITILKQFKPKLIIELNHIYIDDAKIFFLINYLTEMKYKKVRIFGKDKEYSINELLKLFNSYKSSKDYIFV